MVVIKKSLIFILCIQIFSSFFSVTNAENQEHSKIKVYLTGNGIATRLHEPLLKDFKNVDIEFIKIPDNFNDTIMLNNKDLKDWIILGTPVYKHKDHISFSAKNFKNILCEKPVGLSLNEINKIKEIINKHQVLFIVNYALRFLPQLEKIKDYIKNNAIKSAKILCNANFNKRTNIKEWKKNPKLGGGILYSILPHMIDLLNYLDFHGNINSVTFNSNTPVPMDDIRVCSETSGKIKTEIDINLCENFDEFTLTLETFDGKLKTFDLINSSKNKIPGTKYCNNTLSATSEISPWRISFKYLLESMFKNAQDNRLANIEDAENVHKVINVILQKLNIK